MTELVAHLYGAQDSFFNVLLAPLPSFPGFWSLLVVSALAGLLFLLLYGRLSNQKRLRDVKRAISAGMLEAILYRHDPGIALRAQGQMLKNSCLYLACAVLPVLVLMVPCLILLTQLDTRYGYRNIRPGEKVRVSVTAAEATQLEKIKLSLPDGVEAATPPLRLIGTREVVWLVKPAGEGQGQIVIEGPNREQASLPLCYGSCRSKIVSGRYSSVWKRWLAPGGEALEKSPLSEIAVSYPPQYYSFLGYDTHWVIVFALASIVSGLVFARLLGIEV